MGPKVHHVAAFELPHREEKIERLLVDCFDHVAVAHVDVIDDGQIKEPPRPAAGPTGGGGAPICRQVGRVELGHQRVSAFDQTP